MNLEKEYLKGYDIKNYDRPSVAVDIVALSVDDEESDNYRKTEQKKLKLLLVKREEHPFKDAWALPGGFVLPEEDLEQKVVERFKSKTDIDAMYLEQLYTWGELKRDPRGRIISVSYLALLAAEDLAHRDKLIKEGAQNDEAVQKQTASDKIAWFDLSIRELSENIEQSEKEGLQKKMSYELSLNSGKETIKAQVQCIITINGKKLKREYGILQSDLAFDHAKIILYAIDRLKNKIEYTPIAFSLMPRLFTLTQLQMVYEIILNKPLLKANFRRKISHMVEETDEFKRDAGHRPSKLFKFKEIFDF